MDNIIEFSPADRSFAAAEAEIHSPRDGDSKHAEAFRDLEPKICDCVSMAKIAARSVINLRTDDRELVFAVAHVSEMLDALKAEYYAAYHGERQRHTP